MSKKFRAVRSQIKPKSVRKKRRYTLPNGVNIDHLKKLIKKTVEVRPALADILSKYTRQSLYDLTKKTSYYELPLTVPQERKDEFLTVFSQEVTRLLGPILAEKSTRQLKKYYSVSTADHQGPLVSPRLITSNLLAAMPFFEAHDTELTCHITLACGNISFDNPTLPRGLTYHIPSPTDILESIMAFFGRTVDSRPVVYFRPYTTESLNEMKNRLSILCNNVVLPIPQRDFLFNIINSIYNKPDLFSLPTFSDQMTITNARLWKLYFGDSKTKAPDLISLEQEHVVNMLLLKHMQRETLLNKLIFNADFHTLMEKYFEGIAGAFTLKEHSGTFLFWALPPGQKYRQQLWKKNNMLETQDASYSVELTPEAISREIAVKHLIPSVALIFITLCFYYGLRATGGFNQTTYLTEMKKAFSQTVIEYQGKEDADISIPTEDLTFNRAGLIFLKHATGITTPATGLDLILYGKGNTWLKIIEAAKNIPLEKALYRALPSVYSAYCPKEMQEKDLLAITEQDVEKLTGLDKLLYTIPLTL